MNALDWYIVVAYFILILVLGAWAGLRVNNLGEYFLAGRQLGIWIAAISLIATETSAATVIGAPDSSFRGNLAFLQTTMGAVCSRVVVSYFFLDVFYSARVVTVYEYLGVRYDRLVQSSTALLFCFSRVLASGARLYIAALATASITDFGIVESIVFIGIVATAYGTFGGLRAVVWTDVVQGILFLSVSLFSLCYIVSEVGGLSTALSLATESGKLVLFDFSFDLFSATFWSNPYTFPAAFIGGFILGLATHGCDQDMVQRMLACRSSSDSRRSMLLVGLLEIPVTLLYIGLGLALWIFYQNAGVLAPSASESVFPHFISQSVPHGVRGLFLAALLAAAMSSLDSALNALATVSITDVYRPLREKGFLRAFRADPKFEIRLSRLLSFGWGVLLILVAISLGSGHQALLLQDDATLELSRNKELLSLALGVMGVAYGPLLGVFVLAMFTTRGRSATTLFSMLLGLSLVGTLKYCYPHSIGWTWHVVIKTAVQH